MKRCIVMLLITIIAVVKHNIESQAGVLETPAEYGPHFFCGRDIATADVVLSEDGKFILEILESDCEVEEEPPVNSGNRWGVELDEYQREVLAKIVDLESGNQSDEGQQAVVEVIFNRITSPSFPDDLISVLSQKGQFTTWKFVNKGNPNERVYANIDKVVNGETEIFPPKTVFFSRGRQNPRVQARIGGHVFCNEK